MSASDSVKNTLTNIANLTDNKFIVEMVALCISDIDRIKKEQDRDTRHACAEVMLELDNVEIEGSYDNDYIDQTKAHDACMNVKAV